MEIKKGDAIVVTRGKDRGKKAKVLRIFVDNGRITVEGVNIHKRHQRPRKSGEKGQVVSFPAPFAVSNVKLFCNKCGKGVRIRHLGKGRDKTRVCVSCAEKL